jgi:tRNA G26 N,N-dimethylase Trm1
MYWIATSLPIDNRFEANISDPTIFYILVLAILFFIYFTFRIFRPKIRFEKTTPAGAFESDEFKRTFTTCPICSSSLGYEATLKFLTPYIKCRNCGAVWEKVAAGPVWKTELRYLLVEPDKEMRAISLVGKGDVEYFPHTGSGIKRNLGYEVEFWKVLDYINKHEGEISIPQASEELGLSETRLKATIDKLKEKGFTKL